MASNYGIEVSTTAGKRMQLSFSEIMAPPDFDNLEPIQKLQLKLLKLNRNSANGGLGRSARIV